MDKNELKERLNKAIDNALNPPPKPKPNPIDLIAIAVVAAIVVMFFWR